MKKDQQSSNQPISVLGVGAVGAVADVPKERAQFRALIVGNPNYFGNLPKSRSSQSSSWRATRRTNS